MKDKTVYYRYLGKDDNMKDKTVYYRYFGKDDNTRDKTVLLSLHWQL